MKTAIVSLAFPKTPGEAALIRLEQMKKAIELGHVKSASADFDAPLRAWLSSATRILDEAHEHHRD